MVAVLTKSSTLTLDLLGLTPVERNAFWATLRTADHRRGLLRCFERDVATPYGMWADDPVGFWNNILGVFTWSKQQEIGCSVEANKRTVVVASHGVSKTHTAGLVVAWFGSVHPAEQTRIVTTAPRDRQVKTLLWPEIRKAHSKSLHPLAGHTDMTQWKVGDDHILAYGFTANNATEDAVQGIHAPHLLIVVDEGGGIAHRLGNAINSITTGAHVRVLVIGNAPTDDEGTWFENRTKSELWHTIRIAFEDSPNATKEPVPEEVAASLVSQDWVDETVQEFGEESSYVLARVKALFPSGSTNKVMPWSWIEGAMENEEPEPGTWVRLGIDVAADGGDEFVIARSVGNKVTVVHSSSGAQNANPADVAQKALEQIRIADQIRRDLGETRKVRVKIDSLGIGMGVWGFLHNWGLEAIHDAEIVEVKVSEKAKDQKKFSNKRAEMWWTGREMIRPRPATTTTPAMAPIVRLEIEDNKRAAAQLNAPTYGSDTQGRVKIQEKKDIKKAGMSSPDRAEAILLALYEPDTLEPARSNAGLLLGNN